MKRILYIVSVFAALALAGCQKEDGQESSIQLAPESAEGEFLAGTVETTVTSSGEWTMEGDYTWITPSARSGKSGDKVTFTYNVNMSGKVRAALFKLRCGSAYHNFTFRQDSGIIEMNATIETLSAVSGEYKFKMSVASPKDIAKFVTWGLRYSTDADKLTEEGTDVAIEGTPAEGDVEVTVKDLPNDFTYRFVGWLAMNDGTRVYTENSVDVFVPTPFESAVTVENIKARQATFSYEVTIPSLRETGVCLGEAEDELTTDDALVFAYEAEGEIAVGQTVKINPLTVKLKSDDGSEDGWVLDPETEYCVCAYAIRPDGYVVYGPATKFTTMKDPWDNLLLDDSFADDYSRFQSLCEYGPVKDGSLGASQSVTEAASDIQSSFRSYWNTALTSYSADSKYAALFNELAFLKNGTDIVMQNIVWREGIAGVKDPKEANRVGGFAYKVTARNGFLSFTPADYAFVPDNAAAVTEQGMQPSEIIDIMDGASNPSDIKSIKSYWASGYFFLDWGETSTFEGQSYTDILLYRDNGLHGDVFRFNTACFGIGNYNAEPQSAKSTWTLYVNDGTAETSYVLGELESGGYYLRLNASLAGKTVRISKSTGGYPAYIPADDGSCKLISSADEAAYTVPVANKWANKCAVSFSLGKNVCIVKDICVLSDTCFPCGDEIKLPSGYSDWNAETSYTYFKSVGFFAPTDKLYEPHIYKINVTFKTGGNEGFKVLRTNNFTKGGYNSAVQTPPDNNPIDKWLGVNVTTGDSSTGGNVPDWKWKPNTSGDYTIELDLSAMLLRVVKR